MRVLIALLLIAGTVSARANHDVAIFARAYNGYTRTRLPDRSFKPETYVFAEGGHATGDMVDNSLDGMSFYQVAHTVAGPLKARGYVPSFDPRHTDLVIFVFWGMTVGAENGQFSQGEHLLQDATRAYAPTDTTGEGAGLSDFVKVDEALGQAMMLQNLSNSARDQNNYINAGILGFRENLERAWDIQAGLPSFSLAHDVITELEMNRYYVILKAIDFQAFVKDKKYKVMWESRFSVPARGYGFNVKLPIMADAASHYFGENMKRLVRQQVPEGRVEVGTPTVVEPAAK